jgi:Mrp family chromosome partitioning ATPase
MRAYLTILRRHWRLSAVVFLATLAAGAWSTAASPPIYRTEAKLVVPVWAEAGLRVPSHDPLAEAADACRAESLPVVLWRIRSASLLRRAAAGAHLSPHAERWPTVRVEGIGGSNMLRISVLGEAPAESLRLADEICRLSVSESEDQVDRCRKRAWYRLQHEKSRVRNHLHWALRDWRTGEGWRLRYDLLCDWQKRLQACDWTWPQIVEPASTPCLVRRNIGTRLALWSFLALVLALAAPLVRERPSATLCPLEEDPRLCGVPVLGIVPRISAEERPLAGACLGALGAALAPAQAEAPGRTMLVTSPAPANGKTTLAVRLAIERARLGSSVVLVSTEVYRPSVRRSLGITGGQGLWEVLCGTEPLDRALRSTAVPGLKVLLAGSTPADALRLLRSARCAALVAELRHRADLVLFDLSGCAHSGAAPALAEWIDATVLVLDDGSTLPEQVGPAVDRLREAGLPIAGAVWNRVPVRRAAYYYERYYGGRGSRCESVTV